MDSRDIQPTLVRVFDQKIFVQSAIVVEVMATCRRAGTKLKISMGWTIDAHVLLAFRMASHAIVARQCHKARQCDLGLMFRMAGRAKPCIDVVPINRHARIGELLDRMAVVRGL